MLQNHEVDAWLSSAGADLTDDQRAEFARIVRAWDALHADRDGEAADYADQDDAAYMAALERVLGVLDLDRRGRAFRDAKRDAYAGAAIAVIGGMREVDAAAASTLGRMTVRKALGKVRGTW